ncbi:MAG: 2-polyprenyl-3-methyl-6-methoxy-1,4-benzoquinone monooxygenase [Burkholderiales bacterium]
MEKLLSAADVALRTLFASAHASRPYPTATAPNPPQPAAPLSPQERATSGALMRVNHVGEVCAQALYAGQALATGNAGLQTQLAQAAREETDHLAWTQQRLAELGARPSLLNPLWFAGAFALGFAAGRLGDRISLGFVVETENQVEAHLASHLDRLPANDHASRALVAQMQCDEAAHAAQALHAGAAVLPAPVKHLMATAAKVMTGTAHYI